MCALVTGVQTCALPIYQPEAVLDHNIGRRFDARTARREFELARRCVVFGSKRLNGLYYSVQRVGFVISQVSEDRKSVVQGKSVSVRVDLGGRRIIKKKKEVRNSKKLKQDKKMIK